MGTATGLITLGSRPSTAVVGASVKINHTIEIQAAEFWGVPADYFSILVDTDTNSALKANAVTIAGKGSRVEDIHFDMPNKDAHLRLELWSEIPPQHTGVPVERLV